jgi:hypothetical protein
MSGEHSTASLTQVNFGTISRNWLWRSCSNIYILARTLSCAHLMPGAIEAPGRSTATPSPPLGEVPPLDFALTEVGRFPGVVYLAPKPAAPFIALTQAVVERWPDDQPYGGAYEEIIPHLTVAHRETVPSGLAGRLPLTAQAELMGGAPAAGCAADASRSVRRPPRTGARGNPLVSVLSAERSLPCGPPRFCL